MLRSQKTLKFATTLQLNRNLIIQKVLAMVMLLIFTFSITPKKYWHDLVYDHTDFYGCAQNDSKTSISNTGFNCHCDDLVVSSPFIENNIGEPGKQQSAYTEFSIGKLSFYTPVIHTTEDLRGPPFTA